MKRTQITIRRKPAHGIHIKVVIAALLSVNACERPSADPPPGTASTDSSASVATPALDESLSEHFKLIEEERTGPARVRIRQWLNDHPEDARGEFLMGLSYHQEKRYGRALRWFNQAVEHEPVYPPAWHFQGWTNYYLGNAEPARLAFETHLRLDPSEGDSHFALGLLSIEEWDLDRAEIHLNKAIELQSERPDRTKGVSKAKARLSEVVEHRDGDIAQATMLLKESVELHPDHYEAWYRLSRLLEMQGRSDEAGSALEQFHMAKARVRP